MRACICSRPCTQMVLSQSTDRWGGRDSGGRMCPLGGVSHQYGHTGHGRAGLGHIGHGRLGAGELIATEPKELKDT